jgi:hypothetical protein
MPPIIWAIPYSKLNELEKNASSSLTRLGYKQGKFKNTGAKDALSRVFIC